MWTPATVKDISGILRAPIELTVPALHPWDSSHTAHGLGHHFTPWDCQPPPQWCHSWAGLQVPIALAIGRTEPVVPMGPRPSPVSAHPQGGSQCPGLRLPLALPCSRLGQWDWPWLPGPDLLQWGKVPWLLVPWQGLLPRRAGFDKLPTVTACPRLVEQRHEEDDTEGSKSYRTTRVQWPGTDQPADHQILVDTRAQGTLLPPTLHEKVKVSVRGLTGGQQKMCTGEAKLGCIKGTWKLHEVVMGNALASWAPAFWRVGILSTHKAINEIMPLLQ